jgi:hypothetical protein
MSPYLSVIFSFKANSAVGRWLDVMASLLTAIGVNMQEKTSAAEVTSFPRPAEEARFQLASSEQAL